MDLRCLSMMSRDELESRIYTLDLSSRLRNEKSDYCLVKKGENNRGSKSTLVNIDCLLSDGRSCHYRNK